MTSKVSRKGNKSPDFHRSRAIKYRVSTCRGSSAGAPLQTTSFPFLGNRPPAFVLSLPNLSTLPVPPADIIRNRLNHPVTTQTSLKNRTHDQPFVRGAFLSFKQKATLMFPAPIVDMVVGSRPLEGG